MALFKKKTKEVKEKVVKKEAPKSKVKAKIAHKVLIHPRITEKSTELMDKGKYVFKVFTDSTKPEIKKAVEQVYNVEVTKVKTINVRRQRKRLGRTMGWTKAYKKAIVDLKEGQSIEVTPR